MGNTSKEVHKLITIPILVVGEASIITSGITARYNAIKETNRVISKIIESSLNGTSTINNDLIGNRYYGFIIAVCIMYFCICVVCTSMSIKYPVIQLIQEDIRRIKLKNIRRANDSSYVSDKTSESIVESNKPDSGLIIINMANRNIGEKRNDYKNVNQIRYELLHIIRNKTKTILSILLIVIIMLVITGLDQAILSNKKQVDSAYMSTTVVVELKVLEQSRKQFDKALVTMVMDSGLVQNAFIVASLEVKDLISHYDELDTQELDCRNLGQSIVLLGYNDGISISSNRGYQNTVTTTFSAGDPAEYIELLNKNKNSEDIPIIVPKHILESMGLKINDTLYVIDDDDIYHKCIIIGSCNGREILTLVTFIEKISGDNTNYVMVEVTFDPSKNYLIKDFKNIMKDYIAKCPKGVPVSIIFYDAELVNAIEPLE